MTETAIADAQRTAVFNESITRSSGSHTTQWLAFSGQTLQFDCHTNEQVHVGIDEDYRVRRCNLFYHLADDTLEVNEIKSENSGLPQGALIKRHQVQRSDGSGLVGVEDLQVGGSVSLYGRDFYITDNSIFESLHMSYNMIFANYNTNFEIYTVVGFAFYLSGTLFMIVIMLNLLISIISDTFDRIQMD